MLNKIKSRPCDNLPVTVTSAVFATLSVLAVGPIPAGTRPFSFAKHALVTIGN